MREAEQALAALGDTPDKVAASLRDLMVQGDQCDSMSCPIARYLDAKTRGKWSVGAFRASNLNGSTEAIIGLPLPVRAFVLAFDAGLYPELRRARISEF